MCLWLTREWSQSCHIEWDEQQHRRSLLTHSCEFTEKTFCSVDQGTFADARTNGTIEWWGLNSCFNLQTKLVQQICRESEHHEFWQLFQKEGKSRKKKKIERKNTRTKDWPRSSRSLSNWNTTSTAGTSQRRLQVILVPFRVHTPNRRNTVVLEDARRDFEWQEKRGSLLGVCVEQEDKQHRQEIYSTYWFCSAFKDLLCPITKSSFYLVTALTRCSTSTMQKARPLNCSES